MIDEHGLHVDEAVVGRVIEVRAKAVEPDRAGRARRLEKAYGRKHLHCQAVILGSLAGKPVENVPLDADVVLLPPFHHLNVSEGGRPLAHQLQHVVAQAFDTGLNPTDASLVQQPHLLAAQVRLDFVEQLQGAARAGQCRQHALEVFHVQNIVNDFH